MSQDPSPTIQRRKADHIALCASGEVAFRDQGTLLDEVQLVHHSLPDFSVDEVDLTTELLGKKLRAPVVVAGMTGGTEEAQAINRDLARAAEALGIGFGLGSQRAMVVHPNLLPTYAVRDVAPTTLVLGNLGMVQARQMSTAAIRELMGLVGADALCVHLNPAMELIQPGGDRDFSGGRETFKRLVGELGIPVVGKETGSGLSRAVGLALRETGVRTVDVSGAGGTSWVGVETKRAEGRARLLGEELWDWGIPTGASVGLLSDLGLDIIATGGLKNGVDVARALALGAKAGGVAAAALRAHRDGGYEGAVEFLQHVIDGVRAVTFLTGCRRPSELRSVPRVLGSRLAAWLEQAR